MPCPAVRLGPDCSACRCARCWFRPTWTSRGRTPGGGGARAVTPLGPGSFDSDFGGKAAFGAVRRGIAGRIRIILARGAFGAGRAVRLPGPDAEGGGCRSCGRHGVDTTARLMQIDVATRRNLELTRSLSGARAGEPSARARPDGHGRRRAFAGTARVRARDQCELIARHDGVGISSLTCGLETKSAGLSPPVSRHRTGAVAAGAGPGRAAGSGRTSGRSGTGRGDRRPCCRRRSCPDPAGRARSDCLGHEALRDMLDAALVAEPPFRRGMAASSRPASTPTSTRRGRSATRGAA
jgi:DNA mismatch repair protein MutS